MMSLPSELRRGTEAAVAVRDRVAEGKSAFFLSCVRLALCVTGIWSCFCLYGILQEGIFVYRASDNQRFTQTALLLIIEHFVASAASLAVIVCLGQGSSRSFAPDSSLWRIGALVACSQCLAKYASNESLKHVSYPAQALAKSSKTIPAIFGCFFSGKHITPVQWLTAIGIAGGTAGFSMAGRANNSSFEATPYGISLLGTSLLCDGCVASLLQGLRTGGARLTAYEQMFITNFGAFLVLLPFASFTGQGVDGVAFLAANPLLLRSIVIFSLCSALGQMFIFQTIVWFGPDTNAKVTTIRKMASVLVSIAWYSHTVVREQWLGVGLVFASVFAELGEQLMNSSRKCKTV